MKNKISLVLIFCSFVFSNTLCDTLVRPLITAKENALDKLYECNIITVGAPVRLHLGCGTNHFEGYVNIDFPPSEHTVQKVVGADVFANIVDLHFPDNSVDEIRSHHVFEHFDRSAALALLCKWHKCLKVGGKLIIETPDFDGCVRFYLKSKSYKKKQEVIRHLFGSHEADWAIHCDGWYREKFDDVLSKLGFEKLSFKLNHHSRVIYNVTVTAYKKNHMDDLGLKKMVTEILYDSHIGNRKSGKEIVAIWLNNFYSVFNN